MKKLFKVVCILLVSIIFISCNVGFLIKNAVGKVLEDTSSGGITSRVSVASDGSQGNGPSFQPTISGDGRYVAFVSDASNLVDGDTNGKGDIFLHDTQTGETTLVSIASDGSQGKDHSHDPAISRDGRYIAFFSGAPHVNSSNYVWGDGNTFIGDSNGRGDIFLHDSQTGETTLISVANDGSQGNDDSEKPSISSNGRYIAFQSDASNLVNGDTNEEMDVFLHDSQTGETTLISVANDGSPGNDWSYDPSISGDGRFVAFVSDATNLVNGAKLGGVFLHDTQTGETALVSVASDGSLSNGSDGSPSISEDGRYVSFYSDATTLVDEDTNWESDIFLRDIFTDKTTLVSVASDGSQGNSSSLGSSLSGDGRYVVFESFASNLDSGDTNGERLDVFLHNTQTDKTTLVSVASDVGQGNSLSDRQSISGDGRYVVFTSLANNLVSGDTNETADVYIFDCLGSK